MLIFPVCFLLLLLGFAALYEGGLISLDTKRAVLFIGKAEKARLLSCSGTIRRVVRLAAGETLTWRLEAELTAGTLSAELRAPSGEVLLRLDPMQPTGSFHADRPLRCVLVIRFQAASGQYVLTRARQTVKVDRTLLP